VEGYQGKSSDNMNHGLEIDPDTMLTLNDILEEYEKVSNEEHQQFQKDCEAEAMTIIVTQKPLKDYASHKRKFDEGNHEQWPKKVLVVCNDNLSTALPLSLAAPGNLSGCSTTHQKVYELH